MTITLAAVYAPIGFTQGLTGALFREFAVTLAGAVVISGFIALTLSPMIAARVLRGHGAGTSRFQQHRRPQLRAGQRRLWAPRFLDAQLPLGDAQHRGGAFGDDGVPVPQHLEGAGAAGRHRLHVLDRERAGLRHLELYRGVREAR